MISLSSCSEQEPYREGEGSINVICTTFIPFDFARIIGGENVSVTILQDSGADLHNYSPTTATLSAISTADIFVYIGGESDSKWVSDTLKASKNEDLIKVCLMDSVKEPLYTKLEDDWSSHSHSSFDTEHTEHNHDADEHIWTSLKNAAEMALAICNGLSEVAPALKADFKNRADSFIDELKVLDLQYTNAVNSSHTKYAVIADRFPFVYLFHDYNISYTAAFSGCSTEVNASFSTQARLIEAVRKNGLKYILTIEGNDKSLAKTVAREAGCEMLALNSLQSVSRKDIENGTTYLSVMRSNLEILKEVLS